MTKSIRVALLFMAICCLLNGRRKAVDCLPNSSSPFDAQLYRSNQFPDLHVWLTINPDVKLFDNPFKAIVLKQRLFELNWVFKAAPDANNASNQADWIGLFDKAPTDNLTTDQAIYVSTNPAKQSEGKITTTKKYPIIDFLKQGSLPRGCLGYFVAYVRNQTLLASNCIAAYSTWMTDLQQRIRDAPIHDLMIPGTHNSGAYSLGYPQTNIAKRKLNDYTLCQDETVFNQLVYGVRHLDLRVAYRGGGRFTITHDKFHINHNLDDVLDQIARFMELTQGEVVIVDFHRFPSGFPLSDQAKLKEIHKMMLDKVKSKLGKHIMPAVNQRYLIKFGELIDKNKRIIVGHAAWYALDDQDKQLVFPPAYHIWKDEMDSLDKLLPFLKQKMCTTHRNELEAASAFLTTIAKNVILNKYKSLRALSAKVARPLTDEFRDSDWFNCSNVVLTDFVLSNNLIQLSIESNLKRFV